MHVFRSFAVIIFSFLLPCIASAQVRFVTTTSAAKIFRNDILEVSYEVQNGSVDNFSQPAFAGWEVIGGPNMSSSTFISNGARTTSISYQFELKPLRAGVFTIPAAKAVVEGKSMQSNTVSVTVSNKDNPNPQPSASSGLADPFFALPPELTPQQNPYEDYDGYILKENENIVEKTKNNLFIAVDVSRKTCYPGEAIKAVYQLYSRVNMDAHITKRPSFSGFSSIDLPDSTNREFEIVTRNGKQFKVYTIRSVQLYPLQTGMQTLEPAEIEANIQYKKLSNNPYDPSTNVAYPYTVKSDPVSVNVVPFPEAGKPVDFNGVTGNFTINASITQKELAKNEAGSVKVEVKGSGNWAMLQTPVIKWPEGIDAYEPTITESLDSQAVPVAGNRVYIFPFSSNKPGRLTIPPVSIQFFNAESKTYQEENTQPINVDILNKNAAVNKPVEYEQTDTSVDSTQVFTNTVKIVFPILAVLLLVWLLLKSRKKKTDTQPKIVYPARPYQTAAVPENKEPVIEETYQRFMPKYDTTGNEQSHSVTNTGTAIQSTQLGEAEQTWMQPNAKVYFAGVKKEILASLQTDMNIVALTSSGIKKQLLEHGMDEAATEAITSLLEQCEQQAYSPFDEHFDKAQYDEIVPEILALIKEYNK